MVAAWTVQARVACSTMRGKAAELQESGVRCLALRGSENGRRKRVRPDITPSSDKRGGARVRRRLRLVVFDLCHLVTQLPEARGDMLSSVGAGVVGAGAAMSDCRGLGQH